MSKEKWKFKEFKRSSGETDRLALLSKDYDLSKESDFKLSTTIKMLCNEYIMCRYGASPAICEVWDCIIRVAKEIVRRGGCERDSEIGEVKKKE